MASAMTLSKIVGNFAKSRRIHPVKTDRYANLCEWVPKVMVSAVDQAKCAKLRKIAR
jgi:hypothetical protein